MYHRLGTHELHDCSTIVYLVNSFSTAFAKLFVRLLIKKVFCFLTYSSSIISAPFIGAYTAAQLCCHPVIQSPMTAPILKGHAVSSSFVEHFISRQTATNIWFLSTFGTGNALNYIDLMHQKRRIITVAHQLHVCRRVLLDVRGIVRVLEVFVQLLGLKLAL